jgi:CRP/FNR family cyclic AMP-dependent transcriptional regulator
MGNIDPARALKGPNQAIEGLFGELPTDALADLQSLMHPIFYGSGSAIYSEGCPAWGVYILLEGEVRLYLRSDDDKRLTVGMSRNGAILGLASALSGSLCETTAVAAHPAVVACIRRADFLCFLARHPQAYQAVTNELSRNYIATCSQLRTLGLCSSVPEKLARLLLAWCENGRATDHGMRRCFPFTHGEIGEFIGASRETVTRILGAFKSRNLVVFQGATLTIPDRAALEQAASTARARRAVLATKTREQKITARSGDSKHPSRESRRALPAYGLSSLANSGKEKLRAEVPELWTPLEQASYFEESLRGPTG